MGSGLLRLGPLLLASTGFGAAAVGWRSEDPLPRAVAGAAATSTQEGIWIVGGSWWEGEDKQIGTDLYRRTPGAGAWSVVGQLTEGFAHGGFASDGERLWLAGGLTRAGVSTSVRRVDLATGRVTEVARLGGPRVHCGATALGGALWVLGGTPMDGDFARADGAGWRIDFATGRVSALPPGPPWINPLVLALNGRLHVLPGGVWSPDRGRLEPPSVVYLYHPAEHRWETRPLSQTLPRGLAGTSLDDGRALLAGGVEPGSAPPGIARGAWIYHAAPGTLTSLPLLPAPRLAAIVLWTGEDVLLLGGEDRPRGRAATVWRLAGKELP